MSARALAERSDAGGGDRQAAASARPTHRLVTFAGAMREQISATWLALRQKVLWGSAIALFILVVVIFRDVSGIPREPFSPQYRPLLRFNVLQVGSVFALLMGVVTPLAVWKEGQPSRRAYFWTLPVARFRHSLMKVLCGWICLMPLVLAAVCWWGIISPGRLFPLIGFDGHYWLWLVPLGLGTAGYLWGTILTIGCQHPGRSYGLFVLLLAGYVSITEFEGPGMAAFESFTRTTFQESAYGWNTLATGHSRPWVESASGELMRTLSPNPEPLSWAIAMLLWGSAVTALTVLAASRYQEQ